jgi:hypothetical protein
MKLPYFDLHCDTASTSLALRHSGAGARENIVKIPAHVHDTHAGINGLG